MSYKKTLESSCHSLYKSTSEGILPRFSYCPFKKQAPSIMIDQKITLEDMSCDMIKQHCCSESALNSRYGIDGRMIGIKFGCQRQKYKQQCLLSKDKMIDIYKIQNHNLRQQNTYLLQQLRKYQKRQSKLYQHIDKLSLQLYTYREYETNTSSHQPQHPTKAQLKDRISVTVKANHNPLNNSQHSNTFNSTQNSNAFKKSYIQQQHQQYQSEKQMHHLLENMNRQFCQVMDQCTRQTNQNRKNGLRESLANLANQMKQVRKTFKMS